MLIINKLQEDQKLHFILNGIEYEYIVRLKIHPNSCGKIFTICLTESQPRLYRNNEILRTLKIIDINNFAKKCYGYDAYFPGPSAFPYAKNLEDLTKIVNEINILIEHVNRN